MATIIVAKNQTGSPLALEQLPVPSGSIPASPDTVTLTDYATAMEIQSDDEVLTYIGAGSLLLEVNGVTLTQAESLAASETFVPMTPIFADYYDSGTTAIATTATTLALDTSRQSNPLFVLSSDEVTVQANGAGDYLVRYDCSTDETDTGATGVEIWLEVDGSEVVASRTSTEHYTSMTDNTCGRSMILTLAAGEVLRLRGQMVTGTGTIDTMTGGITLVIYAIGSNGVAGPTGATGATGAGSNIIVQDSGGTVSGGPHSTLNFIGELSASDSGAGVAQISVNFPDPAYADYYDVGTTSVETSATTMGLDTSRQSNSFFVLSSDQVTVQTGGAGDYYVRYEVTFGDSDGTNRTCECWLEVDGSEVAASRAVFSHWDEHALNTNNTAGRSVILTVADGAVIRIRGQASAAAYTTQAGGVSLQIFSIGASGPPGPTGPTGAGSDIIVQDSGGTVSGGPHSTLNFVGELSASNSGGGVAQIDVNLPEAKFANYYNSSPYSGITTSASTLPFTTTRISSSAFTMDGSGEEVTINTSGTYRVDYGASSAEAAGNDIVAEMWLEADTGSGFAEVGGTRAKWFHDSNGEEGGNAGFCIITLAATDVIRIRAQVTQGSDQLNTDDNSLRLSVQTVGANGAAGAAGAQGEQGVTGSGSTIIVEDEGSNIPNTPHSNLDFVGAGVTVTDAGSGVATITIPGGGTANIAQYRQTGNLTINTSATTVVLNANDFEDSNYTRSGENVTIDTAGIYRISYSIFFDTTTNARRTCDGWVEQNTTEIVPSRAGGYARNTTDDTASLSATFLVQLAASDVVRLRCQSTGTSGTAQGVGNRMWITLEFVRAP